MTTKWLVWSFEHKGWWVGWSGYTKDINRATRFSLQEAITICDTANHHLHNEPPEEAMCPDWMEGHHAGRVPEKGVVDTSWKERQDLINDADPHHSDGTPRDAHGD